MSSSRHGNSLRRADDRCAAHGHRVLSAGGEDYLGFSQALFIAGARNVVLSLWNADDAATAILMEEFHRNLVVHDLTPPRRGGRRESRRRSGLSG